jgi:nucleoid DNA-binding protein
MTNGEINGSQVKAAVKKTEKKVAGAAKAPKKVSLQQYGIFSYLSVNDDDEMNFC